MPYHTRRKVRLTRQQHQRQDFPKESLLSLSLEILVHEIHAPRLQQYTALLLLESHHHESQRSHQSVTHGTQCHTEGGMRDYAHPLNH